MSISPPEPARPAVRAAPALGLLALPGRAFRRRPRTTLLALALAVLAGAAGAFYLYALGQWHAAQAAVKEGHLADVRGRLELCLTLWPRSVPVHLLAARAARLGGDFPTAEAHLQRCLRLPGGDGDATQLEFLLMRVQTGETDEVAPTLLRCVANKHPESPLILETLARSYMYDLRYGPALSVLEIWMREAPDSGTPYFYRGWVVERLQHTKDAEKDYERALELDPNLVPARLRLAEIQLDHADPEAARAHLERLRAQCPDRPEVTARLGQCRLLQGQKEEARRLLEEAVQRLPNDPDLLIGLAKLEVQEGHPAVAEKWLRQALANDPYEAQAGYLLVSALQAQGRSAEAEEALEGYTKRKADLERAAHLLGKGMRHAANDPDELAEIGTLFLRMKQDRLGLYWLHEALKFDPGHGPAHEALAAYYEKQGRAEEAAAHRRALPPAGGGANKEKPGAGAPGP
jgi:tetratricopeptide (TPR) repeat protein